MTKQFKIPCPDNIKCDWICEKVSYTCNYKYLEIQF